MSGNAMANLFAKGAGQAVEGCVQNVMDVIAGGGAEGEGGDKKEGGPGNMVNNLVNAVSGGADNKEGGAGNMVNSLVNAVSGGDDNKEGGAVQGVSKIIGGLF